MHTNDSRVRERVRDHYSKVATESGCGCGSPVASGAACCSPQAGPDKNYGLALGYSPAEIDSVAEGANMNLGCGNPLSIGKLQPGENVLDLGCGGGFDCFLAAGMVGPTGQVIGVDMTPAMIDKARENLAKIDGKNISFRLGEIEHLPVADESVDVILSNCVINLSSNKSQVWREAFRVLRPGGRCAISDIVTLRELPQAFKEQVEMLTACISGAEQVEVIRQQLENAGFVKIRITLKPESKEFIRSWFPESNAEHYISSATIEAEKPTVVF